MLIGMVNEGKCQVPDGEAARQEICRCVRSSCQAIAKLEMEQDILERKRKKGGGAR
eukprot:CAMPEP_0173407148 /NCGR_PEP_ID=MMETSP1356-20130122/66413_1 /TAXON_ID=77927 ORGANISM="Hemiselmis virescens, Strain PCC157" /NCGR_SAMPLE_ID=MMETSP1356 /ASSEMBLY_ACC=CAM_ASM_000847 /LENGTH=55 /DNA_ID=CAMNT_0014368265 /DNA_START=1 /DNA_END=168 /DNA_ORIENTATION=+